MKIVKGLSFIAAMLFSASVLAQEEATGPEVYVQNVGENEDKLTVITLAGVAAADLYNELDSLPVIKTTCQSPTHPILEYHILHSEKARWGCVKNPGQGDEQAQTPPTYECSQMIVHRTGESEANNYFCAQGFISISNKKPTEKK